MTPMSEIALQWSRRTNAAETILRERYRLTNIAFNGAAARMRRKPGRFGRARRSSTRRFNGAAARMRRKLSSSAWIWLHS